MTGSVLASSGRVVVVGASLAGWRATEALRHLGHKGPITVIGAEVHPPYDRPPLSKQVLTGRVGADDVALTGRPGGDDLGVDWRLGAPATGLDLDRRVVLTAGGPVPYDGLVVATGAHARTLPHLAGPDLTGPDLTGPDPTGPDPTGPDLTGPDGVHLLRTLDDALALRAALVAGRRVVVIGAGFVGLEVAASARAEGLEVTVVEAAPSPLLRAVGPEVGRIVADLHRRHGVDLRLGVQVEGLTGTGRVEGVRLAGGEVVAADVVVVGVGAAPSTAWLEGSGVDLDDGLRTDSRLRVLCGGRPLPDVVAAGDVVRWDRPGASFPVRVEHWSNAADQGAAAAGALLLGDRVEPFSPVPYFWSDQHGRKIQVVGEITPGDEMAVVDGAVADDRFVAAFGRAGRLVAALGFSRPAKVMQLQRAIADGAPFPPVP